MKAAHAHVYIALSQHHRVKAVGVQQHRNPKGSGNTATGRTSENLHRTLRPTPGYSSAAFIPETLLAHLDTNKVNHKGLN